MHALLLLSLCLAASDQARTQADVVVETPQLRAVLGPNGLWRSLVEKSTGTDLLRAQRQVPLASVAIGQKVHDANSLRALDRQWQIAFAGCDTQLILSVQPAPGWIAFRLQEIRGTRPDSVTLLRLATAITDHAGAHLGLAWNDRLAIGLRATNLQTQVTVARRKDHTQIVAVAQDQPGPRLEGSAVALLAVPTAQVKPTLAQLADSFHLPRNSAAGQDSKDLPAARESYWFVSLAEPDVDQWLRYCELADIRQILITSSAWCQQVGHYTFRPTYPAGLESLKRVVSRLQSRGIQVGMHCFASKISKTDAYVTPVPDRRFWVDMRATLAEDVDAQATSLRLLEDLSQWPGSPLTQRKYWEGGVTKHQEIVLDDEIVRYEQIGPEGQWNTLLGCRRGAWGTKAAAHRAGTEGRHYGVDGCINGYIIDQETGLLDEATGRLAAVFNACNFDLVYFDGGEDVDRNRFNYYVSNFQATAMSKFTRRPLVHMGTCLTHNLWHSFTRSGTVDTYLNTIHGRIAGGIPVDKWPTVREHIDRSVRRLANLADDMLPGELGWFGIWPKGPHTDGLQLDEIEYLMTKSLGYDAPISLETNLGQMESHPLTPGILQIVRAYQGLRRAGRVPAATRQALRETGKDWLLFRAMPDAVEQFVPVTRVETTAPGIRVWIGPLGQDTVAAVWHETGKDGRLLVPCPALSACDVEGKAIPVERSAGATSLALGPCRTTLRFARQDVTSVRALLAAAQFEARKLDVLWLQAEDYQRCEGATAKGSAVKVEDTEALGDFVVATQAQNLKQPHDWYWQYTVHIPRPGRWTIWARVRYPRGGDQSFGLGTPDEPLDLSGTRAIGNCGQAGKAWHWTGRGGGLTSAPPGMPITRKLPAGPFTFRIYPREGTGAALTAPRLDALCISEDPEYRPTDADAQAALQPAKR